MAFVLPAGDYERALRMAGASNFMEALEAGVDRGMRRQAMREKSARDRELYYRALEDQDAPLMSTVDMAPSDVTMEDLLAGIDTMAVADEADAVQRLQSAGAMEQALGGAGAMGAAPSAGTARAATSTKRRQDAGAELGSMLGPELPPASGESVATPSADPKGPLFGPRAPSPERDAMAVYSDAREAYNKEVKRLFPYLRPGGAIARRRIQRDPGAAAAFAAMQRAEEDYYNVAGRSPGGLSAVPRGAGSSPEAYDAAVELMDFDQSSPQSMAQNYQERRATQAAREDIKRKLSEAIGLGPKPVRYDEEPRPRGTGITEALNFIAEGRTEDAQRILGDSGKAHPDLRVGTVRSASSPEPGAGASSIGDAIGAMMQAPTGGAAGGAGAAGAGLAASLWGQPGGPSFLEAYPYAQAMAGGGALPGAGAMAGASTADQRMSGAVRGEPMTAEQLMRQRAELRGQRMRQRAEARGTSLPGAEEAVLSDAEGAVRSSLRGVPTRFRTRLDSIGSERGLPLAAVEEAVASQVERPLESASAVPEGLLSTEDRLVAPGETFPAPTEAPPASSFAEGVRRDQLRRQGIEENALGAGSMAPGDLGFGTTSGSPLDQAVAKQQEVAAQAAVAEPEAPAQTAETEIQGTDSKGNKYKVVAGDTVSALANQYGTSVQAMFNANKGLFTEKDGTPRAFVGRGGKRLLEGVDYIEIGDELIIPSGKGLKDGGEPGPVDARPLTTGTGPSGEVTSSQGVLARLQRATKNNAELKASLEAEQKKNPTSLLNPFTRFGRGIAYTPALEAVSRAVLRAQRGDFGLINNLAGRPVRNDEVMDLYRDYEKFVRGAKGNAKQITINRAIREKQKALAEETNSANAFTSLFADQLVRNGMDADEALSVGGYAADLHKVDKNMSARFLQGYQQLGADQRKRALARLKAGLRVSGKGIDPIAATLGVLKPNQVVSGREDAQSKVNSLAKSLGDRGTSLSENVFVARFLVTEEGIPVPSLSEELLEGASPGEAQKARGIYEAFKASVQPSLAQYYNALNTLDNWKQYEAAIVGPSMLAAGVGQKTSDTSEPEDLGEAPEGYVRKRRPGTNEVYDIPIVDGNQGPIESWILVEAGQG